MNAFLIVCIDRFCDCDAVSHFNLMVIISLALDVGPTLGIAKSSSLESLQTAVEACIADEKAKDSPYPRPLPRVIVTF